MLNQSTFQDPSMLTDILHTSQISAIQLQDIELETPNVLKSSRLKEVPEKPIEVLSDDEEKDIFNSEKLQGLFKTKIEEAKLTKSKANILKVLYIELHFKGSLFLSLDLDEKLKESKFNGMIKAYVSKNLKTSKKEPFDIRNSFFFQMMMPKPGTFLFQADDEFIENEYILYGCDLLSHRAIEKMFLFYSPSIKWIDSSHCKLTFLQKLKGWEAVVNNCRNLDQLLKDQASDLKVQNLMNNLHLDQEEMEIQFENKYNEEYAKLEKSKKEYHLLKKYVELMPYYELGFRRRLLIRNVTVVEQKIGYNLNGDNKSQKSFRQDPTQEKKPDSDFKKYQILKEKLWNEIESDPLVKPMYQKIEKEMQQEQQLLKASRRPKPKQNDRPNFRPNNQYKSYGQSSIGERSQFDARSQRFYGENVYSNPRSRSRDPTARYNRTERGENQGYGQGFQRNFEKRHQRYQNIQKTFDNYIEQRQGIRIIQNPSQYLEPQFIDERTGTLFYRNPFYNPDAYMSNESRGFQRNAYPRNNFQRNNFYPMPYPTQSHQNQENILKAYEYESNGQPIRGTSRKNYSQRDGSSQYGGSSRSGKNPLYQGQGGSQKNQSSLKSSRAEDEFNKYVAQRQSAKNRPSTPQITSSNNNSNEYINRKGSQFNPNQSTDNVFGQDPDFSIITEEKSQQQFSQRKELIHEENLENILNEINDDETPIVQQIDHLEGQADDSESEGLEFLLESRERSVKREVKTEFGNKYATNMAKNPGYIVETIKAEHVPRWMKSNHDIEGYQENFSNSIPNPQFSVQFEPETEYNYNQQRGSESTKNFPMKKKIPRKSSSSSRKRSESSKGKQ